MNTRIFKPGVHFLAAPKQSCYLLALVSYEFTKFLNDELKRRKRRNPRYSLRSFARDLSLEPSLLSKLSRGIKPATDKMISRLAPKLGMTSSQMARFSHPSKDDRPFRLMKEAEINRLTHWCHYAILELTRVDGFKPDPRWIARTLGISYSRSSATVTSLLKYGYLKISEDGRWYDDSANISTAGFEMTNSVLKKQQKQILGLSRQALDGPLETRDHSYLVMAVSKKDVSVIKKKMKSFRRSIAKYVDRSRGFDSVYYMAMSFFPTMKKRG